MQEIVRYISTTLQSSDSAVKWLDTIKKEVASLASMPARIPLTEEDLEKIKNMGVPTMEQAINAYYSIKASSEFREVERLREKARHDEAQALHYAKQERNIEIARNLLKTNLFSDQIAMATGLTVEEVENLRVDI